MVIIYGIPHVSEAPCEYSRFRKSLHDNFTSLCFNALCSGKVSQSALVAGCLKNDKIFYICKIKLKRTCGKIWKYGTLSRYVIRGQFLKWKYRHLLSMRKFDWLICYGFLWAEMLYKKSIPDLGVDTVKPIQFRFYFSK